ncbi:MAG: hypothetical protein U0572_10195 [Phycisphaerales bacterium]
MKISIVLTTSLASLALSSIASAHHHHHATVATPTGTPGEQISIVVGYYREEADMFIDDSGRIIDGEAPFVLRLPGTFPDGPLAGQLTGTGLALTSDFFAKSGLLTGGDFYYRIVDVTPLDGGDCVLTWAHTDERTGEVMPEALSSGGDAISQSLHVGVGGHPHGQIVAASAQGMYDVTIVAWDGNGTYLDSAPVTFTIDASPNPADLDQNGEVDAEDLAMLLGAWGSPAADLDGDGTTGASDLGILLGAWG